MALVCINGTTTGGFTSLATAGAGVEVTVTDGGLVGTGCIAAEGGSSPSGKNTGRVGSG